MAADYAVPPQKTHSIVFEPKQLCYPWHPWCGRSILTRAAGGAHASLTYFCKLSEAPPDAMLAEVPRWMFDAAHCATMRASGLPNVDCATLRALKSTITEQRASINTGKAVIQPQVSRQAGDGDTDDNDSTTSSHGAVGAVRPTPRRTAVARSGGDYPSRTGQTTRATPPERSRGQSKPRSSRQGKAR
jgi:hypothetical protein